MQDYTQISVPMGDIWLNNSFLYKGDYLGGVVEFPNVLPQNEPLPLTF